MNRNESFRDKKNNILKIKIYIQVNRKNPNFNLHQIYFLKNRNFRSKILQKTVLLINNIEKLTFLVFFLKAKLDAIKY